MINEVVLAGIYFKIRKCAENLLFRLICYLLPCCAFCFSGTQADKRLDGYEHPETNPHTLPGYMKGVDRIHNEFPHDVPGGANAKRKPDPGAVALRGGVMTILALKCTWMVTSKGSSNTISLSGEGWICTCPDFAGHCQCFSLRCKRIVSGVWRAMKFT